MSIHQLPTGLFALLALVVLAIIGAIISRSTRGKISVKTVEIPVPAVEKGISAEEIAAIMGAISAVMTTVSPGLSFTIASITRADNSSWKQAGQIENLQSF